MADVLTDADIQRHDAAATPPSVLTDADISAHDQGNHPSYWSQVAHNALPSAIRFLQSVAPGPTSSLPDMSATSPKPGETEGPSLQNVWNSTAGALKQGASDLWNKITNPKDFFRDDPVGAAQLYGNLAAGGIKGVLEATPESLKAAVKAGAPDVAQGAAKAATGAAVAHVPVVGTVPGGVLAYQGGKQVMAGFGKAIKAGREALQNIDDIKSGVSKVTGRVASPTDWDAVMDMYAGLKAPNVAGESGVLPGEDTALLDGISQGMGGKSFAKLDAKGQATVRQVAAQMAGDHVTSEAASAPVAAAPAPIPAAQAAPAPSPAQVSPQAPSSAPALSPPAPESGLKVPLKARRMAQNLLEDIRQNPATSGNATLNDVVNAPSIPATGEGVNGPPRGGAIAPGSNVSAGDTVTSPTGKPQTQNLQTDRTSATTRQPESPNSKSNPYEEKARTEKANSLAQALYLGGQGVRPTEAAMMNPDHWRMAATMAKVNEPSLATQRQALQQLQKLWSMDAIAQRLKTSMEESRPEMPNQ
jgi:hypothetical protein